MYGIEELRLIRNFISLLFAPKKEHAANKNCTQKGTLDAYNQLNT